ncbi:hypothetical protein E4K67_18240 [Desulfosporosinus fructosivorans]|uniref:Uncharacterized protein n=1 Tax=Desulfosporosinus fructosivorans TaxID=2018669 RepID=A0A4Z0R3R0_9FIRM|nr:hypothetical protein [Desulfosporosinus fructosivorans]TGE37025.1 hypothetical protein E4K67_18240 [Desulfosporosinus fructosivorans]
MNELKLFIKNNLNNPEAIRELYLSNQGYYDELIRKNKSKLCLLKFMYPQYYRALRQGGILS